LFICLCSLALTSLGCGDSEATGSSSPDVAESTEETGEETGSDIPSTEESGEESGVEPSGPLVALAGASEAPDSGLQVLESEAEGGMLTVKVRGVGLQDVFGAAFHITWDPEVLSLDSMTAASPLTTSIPSESIIHEREGGRVIYGTARFHTSNWGQFDYKGVDLEDAVFATLTFAPVAPGETTIGFRDRGRDIRDSSLTPVEDLAWSGLPVTVSHADEGGK